VSDGVSNDSDTGAGVATATRPPRPPEGKVEPPGKGPLARREQRLGWGLTTPGALIVLALVLFPILWNVALSFQEVKLVELQDVNLFSFDPTLDNYRRVTGVEGFWPTIRTTFVYTILSTIGAIAMGLWAALVVQKPFKGRSLVRGFMLFPYVTPIVALALLWQQMLNPNFGIINVWIEALGGNATDFFATRSTEISLFGASFEFPVALSAVIAFEIWRNFPFAFLFLLARLQAIPADMYEAADVDGATISQKFWHLTMPQLRGVISVLFLLRFIWTFNKFDDVFLLTGGAAGTNVIAIQIVEWLRGRFDIGAAAALGVVLAVILSVSLAIYMKFFYEEETE
jgi:multiple sugar transport system permease protein